MQINVLLFNFSTIQNEGLEALFKRNKKYWVAYYDNCLKNKSSLISNITKCQIFLFSNIEIDESAFQTIQFVKSINNEIKFISIGRDYTQELLTALSYSDVYLDAKTSFNTLTIAIDKVISEGVYIDPAAASNYIKLLSENQSSRTMHLTKREIQVLQLVCAENSNKEIASQLQISNRTVENHRKNILIKTNSKGTAGLVIFAIKNGLLEL